MFNWRAALIVLEPLATAAGAASPPEERAVCRRALSLAEALGWRLTFLGVLDTPSPPAPHGAEPVDEDGRPERAAAEVAFWTDRAASRGLQAEGAVQAGRPEHVLSARQTAQPPDVVFFPDGGEALPTLLAGPAPSAVWIVRAERGCDPPTFLVLDDLSPAGAEALRTGVAAAQLLHARLVVLHAVDGPPGSPGSDDAERAVIARLRETDYRTIGPGVQVHVRTGATDVVLHAALREFDVDLLVLGVQAAGDPAGSPRGGRAESVLAAAECSVLVVKAAAAG